MRDAVCVVTLNLCIICMCGPVYMHLGWFGVSGVCVPYFHSVFGIFSGMYVRTYTLVEKMLLAFCCASKLPAYTFP